MIGTHRLCTKWWKGEKNVLLKKTSFSELMIPRVFWLLLFHPFPNSQLFPPFEKVIIWYSFCIIQGIPSSFSILLHFISRNNYIWNLFLRQIFPLFFIPQWNSPFSSSLVHHKIEKFWQCSANIDDIALLLRNFFGEFKFLLWLFFPYIKN